MRQRGAGSKAGSARESRGAAPQFPPFKGGRGGYLIEWHPELLGGVHLELYRALVEACG